MKFFYGEFDGEEFPTQDKLFGLDQLMQLIMQYGEQALKAIEQMLKEGKDPEQSELLEQLIKDGMLDRDGKGKLRLTPRAISRMQRRALMEVFSNLRTGQREGHEKITPGQGGERIEGTKPYQYGDPVSEIDLHQTLHNALARHGLPLASPSPSQGAPALSPSSGTPGEGSGMGDCPRPGRGEGSCWCVRQPLPLRTDADLHFLVRTPSFHAYPRHRPRLSTRRPRA